MGMEIHPCKIYLFSLPGSIHRLSHFLIGNRTSGDVIIIGEESDRILVLELERIVGSSNIRKSLFLDEFTP